MKKVLVLIFTGVFIMANTEAKAFDISSAAVQNNVFMAAEQADGKCGGENVSPDLKWSGIPAEAKSLALIVHDPDAPHKHGWYHWIVVDIPVTVTGIEKGAKFAKPARALDGYNGPCPPAGHGVHHYNFTLYALNVERMELKPSLTPYEIEKAVKAHALAQTKVTGLYERK